MSNKRPTRQKKKKQDAIAKAKCPHTLPVRVGTRNRDGSPIWFCHKCKQIMTEGI